jgi:chromosomal replication initiator protein
LREFVAGPENQLLTQAQLTVTSDWGRFNPLFIHGMSGIGKTHLLHCLLAAAQQTYPRLNDVFITGADYARAVAEAIDVDSLDELREKHCAADLIVIDGLHQLVSKSAAQRELIRTLDHGLKHDLQVIVASLGGLDEISGLHTELTSRLAGGLVLPLAPPEAEARKSIVRRLAASQELTLAEHELQEIVRQPSHSVTTVTDLLSAINQNACDDDLAQRSRQATQGNELTVKMIVKSAAKNFRMTARDLTGSSRRRSAIRARAVCVYLARTLLSLSFQKIGQQLGNRDHTTVLHSFRRAELLIGEDPCFQRAVQEITKSLTEP